jgi:hypothetical protein
MIVHFSASARTMTNDIELYRTILKVIGERGHVINNDWTETALKREQRKTDWDMPQLVERAMNSIQNAELLIAEVSDGSSFGVGYEVAMALQLKKPILLLIDEERTHATYATGLRNELITIQQYNKDNISNFIHEFLDENNLQKKDLRFNFVIDRQIHNHLRWRSFKTGKTKAEVVRDLLQKDMQNGQD